MIWNGNIHDTTNYVSDKFLQINSCGLQNITDGYTVVRTRGRVDYHVLFIMSGRCTAVHNGQTYALTAGSVLVYYPNEPHKYTFTENCKSLWCHFSGYAAEEILASVGVFGGVSTIQRVDAVFNAFSAMIQQFHLANREKFALPHLLELLYLIRDDADVPHHHEINAQISRALCYIQTNYNKNIRLDELASMTGYSKSRFSHLFAEETHTTPKSYQNALKLNAAREMLLSTDRSVTEITYLCGFNDLFYFSKLFKQKYGVSPMKYRALSASSK